MSKMQQALTGQQAGSNLQGTMSGQQTNATLPAQPAPAGAAPAPAPDDQAQENAAVDEYKKRLTDIMASHKDVDYDALYSDLQTKLAAQKPQMKPVNPLVAAAASFGSPRAGEQMVGMAQQRSEEQKQLDEKRMSLSLQILDRKAEQAMAKGKADEAMQANAEASRLETELQRIRDERTARHAKDLADVKDQAQKDIEDTKQKGRETLQRMRDAVNRERIRAAESKLGALKLAPQDQMAMMAEKSAAFNRLERSTDFNQETMEMPSADQIDEAHKEFDADIADIASRYGSKVLQPDTKGVVQPAPQTPAPAAAGAAGGSKWAEALAAARKAREGAQKK